MKKLILMIIIFLLIKPELLLSDPLHTREMMMQIVDAGSNPIARIVKLYKNYGNYFALYRSGTSESYWKWTAPNANVVCDIGDNNTEEPTWEPIVPGNYLLWCDNKFATLYINTNPINDGDFNIKFQNGIFAIIFNNRGVTLGSTQNWDKLSANFIQLKSDGLTNIGTVAIGQGSSFSDRFSAPFEFNTNTNDTYLFDADPEIYSFEKYHHYQNITDVRNFREQYLGTQNYSTTASFNPTFAGITVQNIFPENPSLSPTDDIIQFKDPWLIDYNDPQHGYKKRSRGQNDAIFQNLPSPFYPNYSTSYNGNTYKGIFFNQDPQQGLPNYSVRSPIQQPNDIFITQTGRYHKFYFFNWSWSGTDPLTQNNIVNGFYETPVVFRSGSATVTANLKGTQLSNNANTYKNTSQRKFIKTPDGKMYITYESVNCVWLERSTDNGVNWEIMNDGKPIGNAEGISPCLDYEPDNSLVVLAYQQKIGSSYGLKYLVYNPETNGYRYGDVEWIGSPPPESIMYSHNAQIVVSWNKDNDALFVWKSMDELLYSACILHALGTDWKISGSILYYESDYNTPTLYCNKSITSLNGIKYFHLAYQNLTSEIHYRLLTLNVSNPLDPRFTVGGYTNISANSGYYTYYNPTITGTDRTAPARSEYIRVAWIGFRDSYPDGLPPEGGGGSTPAGESRVLYKFKFTNNTWTDAFVFGNNVGAVNVNKGSEVFEYWEPFAMAWSEWNTNSVVNKYVNSYGLGTMTIRTLSTTGEEIQINNGTDLNSMYVNAFHRHSTPYFFNLSESLSEGFQKIETLTIIKGREGVVTKDSTDFYYSVGDILISNNNIDFIEMPDSINIENLQTMNDYLISEPFNVNATSTLAYSVEYGIIDSLAAVNALSDSTEISFRVELVDYQTNEVLGVFDEVMYSYENVFQYNNISYEIDMTGIGNRTVVLRLVANTNADCEYSISRRFADSESLNKSGTKHILYNETVIVKEYALEQNYPNPFNPVTTIKYQIPKAGNVVLKIYDILGSEVTTLVDEPKIEGRYEVSFDASSLASGVYIYRLNVNDYVNVKKMVLLK